MTVAQTPYHLLEQYLTYITDKSPDTQRAYRRILTAFVDHLVAIGTDPLGTGLPDGETMENVIASYLDSLYRTNKAGDRIKISPASKRTYLSTISSFYIWMIDIKKITHGNPAATLLRSKNLKRSPIGPNLQESELRTLFELFAAPSKAKGVRFFDIMRQRDHCMVHLAAACGLRRIELHRMDIRHYDRDRQVITVRGKGGRIRTVPVPDLAATVLCHYLDEVRPVFPRPIKEDRHAFFLRPIYDKERGISYSIRMPRQNITARIGRIMEQAGLTKGRGPHTLRRSYGAWLLHDSGGNLRLVQEILGHASVSTTERYTALSSKDAEDMARRAFRERAIGDG